MRIATANAYDASLESLMNRQVKLSETQEQMTTGKRVNHASDDPAAAARANASGVNLDEEAARLIQFQQSYQAAAKILQVAQSVFDTMLQTVGA